MSAEDEAERRQQEINAFAAMAAGDFSSINFESSSTTTATTKPKPATDDNDERGMFAQAAAQPEDSGTFQFKKSDKIDSNLEAAAAALADPPPSSSPSALVKKNSIKSRFPLERSGVGTTSQKMKSRTPMHTQRVFLAKPLFFGQVPPRIVTEARQIVSDALKDQQQDASDPSSINVSTLPPGVRNLIGAFRAYGNGVSILPGAEEKDENLQQTSFVSVFCPKWSEVEETAAPSPDPSIQGDETTTMITDTTIAETAAAESTTQESFLPTSDGSFHKPASTDNTTGNMSERDWFSMMAREEVDGGSFGNASASDSLQELDSSTRRQNSNNSDNDNGDNMGPSPNMFSQWALGESSSSPNASANFGDSMVYAGNETQRAKEKQEERSEVFNSGTFLNIVAQDDSDDDSVVGSELKKKVGVNEHLNAALAYLENDGAPYSSGSDAVNVIEDRPAMTQILLTKDGARPLSNHELMNGSAPLFSVDDSPLPVETDLGIHETRDEQVRSREQKNIQAIIENVCPQNIMGSLACPNPAMGPDDTHSWNTKSSTRIVAFPSTTGKSNPMSPAPTDRIHKRSPSTDKASNKGKLESSVHSKGAPSKSSFPFTNTMVGCDPRSRFGWWNKNDQSQTTENGEEAESANAAEELPLQLPPLEHVALLPHVDTGLEPASETLHKQNLPLSRLNPATSMAEVLPFLSDRPPSYRFLQVDTQAVEFSSLGGEIEPLFCSVAVYHVESVSQNVVDPSMPPKPDLSRCGKVTETLHFDVVSDREVEERCKEALFPYPSSEDEPDSQGTRCGVFPLPSNLSISNLYATILVKKVVSEGTDFEPYIRPGRNSNEDGSRQDRKTLEAMRARAEKASNQQGKFIMPFAFGVAPLIQVFGADVPQSPRSRAVQIPLFRFSSGQGERQIIDHIMVMLNPSMSGAGGTPAPILTNGGYATLVMRNFGYLGLHSVVDYKSSLARDRLVDFTGESQLMRKERGKGDDELAKPENAKEDDTIVVSGWKQEFIAKPTVCGGRNRVDMDLTQDGGNIPLSLSPLYAQEVSPLSLNCGSNKIPVKSQRGGRKAPSAQDIEPYYHTTFCNQLLCHPRSLRNCPKGNIVVKVEIREMEWSSEYSAYFARIPELGPCMHNPRRGPHLVSEVFTSCSSRCIDPSFLEEVKINLPLVLDTGTEGQNQRSLSVFFTVFKLSFSTRKKWARRLRGTKKMGQKVDEISGDLVGDSALESESSGSCHLVQLACGHLPISSRSAIIGNGVQEVKLTSIARYPRKDLCDNGKFKKSTFVVSEIADSKGIFSSDMARTDNDETGDSESAHSGHVLGDNLSSTSATDSMGRSDSIDERKRKQPRSKAGSDAMSLEVKITVQSSIHAQNSTLGDFFGQETCIAPSLQSSNLSFGSLTRGALLAHIDSDSDTPMLPGTAYELEKLLISTVDISKPSMCSISDVSRNLLRVTQQLWSIVIAGTAESGIKWANPKSVIPLRIQAFATLLQLLGSTTIFFAKRGLTELDGTNKWNLITLSRVLALLFDEGAIFGKEATEPISSTLLDDVNASSTKSFKKSAVEKRRRHVRSNFEFLNLGDDNGERRAYGGSDILFSGLPHDDPSSLSSSGGESSPSSKLSKPSLSRFKTEGSVPSPTPTPFVDSVNDFKNALEAGYREENEGDEMIANESSTGGTNEAAQAMIKAFSGPLVGRKRWMTAPAPNLATISEDGAGDTSAFDEVEEGQKAGTLDAVDTELLLKAKSKPKQMRVPNVKKAGKKPDNDSDSTDERAEARFGSSLEDIASDISSVSVDTAFQEATSIGDKSSSNSISSSVGEKTLPRTDDEIESAGISFLEAIERSFGLSGVDSGVQSGEEKRVGHAHHRKTRSHCSIDWTIPNDDLLVGSPPDTKKEATKTSDLDMSMNALSAEKMISIRLPNFVDRILSLGDATVGGTRWFPFAYEIVIMQWLALLRAQKSSSAGKVADVPNEEGRFDRNGGLTEAASRTGGVIIACAPVLFEIIKQSLGWRVDSLFERLKGEGAFQKYPALITFDDVLLSSLTEVIIHVTDACLDTRNFDSWDTQKTCNDVNDSIVLFLRDLFAFLDPECVYRLMRAYLSRLSRRDDNARNRDSKIGLWCAWEVTKLQMNSVSALLRFPDFIKVNSPQASSWGEGWTEAFTASGTVFYDNVLTSYSKLGNYVLEDESEEDEVNPDAYNDDMMPHWLAGFVIEMCVLGIEHAEQNVQKRSAALLLELFWSNSQESLKDGTSSIVASMYITFLEKIISRTAYLASCFHAKSQVRQDILRCVVFVLQYAPAGLLRALWRVLCNRASGKGAQERFGGLGFIVFAESADDIHQENQRRQPRSGADLRQENDVFEMFCLLNLCLSTLEYEGSDEQSDGELMVGDAHLGTWKKEYLIAKEEETMDMMRRRRLLEAFQNPAGRKSESTTNGYATTSSRKWHAHDGALVAIKTAMQIVRELRLVLEPSEAARSFFNPARQRRRHSMGSNITNSPLAFCYSDTVVFVRAAASVYLHSLALRQSDIVLVKTLHASVELVKIHGIKMFNEAVGETLQHWMRAVLYHCGSRRAEVRVPASDFLELILRSTWDTFGSFFRIRIPLLAVQTEVMERIVATAAARHYRDQRMMGTETIEFFSNGSAEASLAPLWRTLDRLHHQSASQNVAFKSALIRLAEKLKKLFRAYIAAHALSYLNRSKLVQSPTRPEEDNGGQRNLEAETLIRANRTRLHRVINASAGYSKQFLGFYSTSLEHNTVAHHEAVEDAFLDAADVFSPTELPDHRVAWLRKLAEFHESRGRFAEEATCHYHIYLTYKMASRLHGSLWSSTPFLPWIDKALEGMHLDGEGAAGNADDASGFDGMPELDLGKHVEKTNQFRRIFYRHENSIRNGADIGSGCSKFAFYGVTLASEYHTVTPWITLRGMEANMLEEAELAGELFLSAGVVASSQYVWSLASQYYAEKFIYGKLTQVYERLAMAVVSHVPPVDSSMYQEVCVTEPIGRFYRVWFHGGAPDELMGAEFVYRTASSVTLDQFGNELRNVIRCIVPEKTPIHLVLDGRPEESVQQNYVGFGRMGSTLEPVRVKVTPLRPLLSKTTRVRGMPEWFDEYVDTAFGCKPGSTGSTRHVIHRSNSLYSDTQASGIGPHHRDHARSFSASVFSSAGVSTPRTRHTMVEKPGELEGGLVGADKFSFIQPISKGRTRATRDWLKGSSSDFAEKTLRVTQLQVGQMFPGCVSRQVVVHRVVYTQSPLEAAVDGICQWCAVLFRTAIATKGRAVLGIDADPGIGKEAAKVVSDSIYSSRVKEIGVYLLQKNNNVAEEDDDVLQSFDRLGDDEVNRLQLKLARSLVVFLELIHLLVARNRDLLLAVIQERKGKVEPTSVPSSSMHSLPATSMHSMPATSMHSLTVSSIHSRNKSFGNISLSESRHAKSVPRQNSVPLTQDSMSLESRARDEISARSHKQALSMGSMGTDWDMSTHGMDTDPMRTNKAMNIQSELQRAFLGLTKDLYPMILGIMGSETPKWLKSACQESYMKGSAYRNTKIPIGEELGFDDIYPHEGSLNLSRRSTRSGSIKSHASDDGMGPAHRTLRFPPGSPGGSLETSSAVSRGSFRSRRSYER